MGNNRRVGSIVLAALLVAGLWFAPVFSLGLGLLLLVLARAQQRRGKSDLSPTLEVANSPKSMLIYGLAGVAFLGALLFFMRSFYNYLDSASMGSDPLCFLACLVLMAVATSLERQKPPDSDLF